MKVFRIGDSEVGIIKDAVEYYGGAYELQARNEKDPHSKEAAEDEAAHIRTVRSLLNDLSLQELCEKCLSYFWDRLSEEGLDNPDVEYLAEEMGLSERELRLLFMEAGYDDN